MSGTWLAKLAPPLLALVVFVALWQGAVQWFALPAYLVPPPGEVLAEAWGEGPQLLSAALATLGGSLAGFALALLLGTALALLFAQAAWLRAALFPWAIFLQTVPVVAIAPLIVVWSGPGFRSVVLVSLVLSLFPILSNATTGLVRVDPALLDLFSVHNATPRQILFRLRLPHAVPSVVAGARVSAGLSVIGSIVGEFTAGYAAQHPGLGNLILQASGQMRTPLLFACVGASTLLGLGVFLACDLTAKVVLRRLDEPHRPD